MRNVICNRPESSEFNPLCFLTERKDADGNLITDEKGIPIMRVKTEAQKLWFRLKYPLGSIKTEVQFNTQLSLVMAKAEISAEGVFLASAHDYAVLDNLSGLEFENAIKACETGAVSRALESAGFGCEAKLNELIADEKSFDMLPNSDDIENMLIEEENPFDEFAQFGISPQKSSWEILKISGDNTSGIPDKYLGKKICEYSPKQLSMFIEKAANPRCDVSISDDIRLSITEYLAQAV